MKLPIEDNEYIVDAYYSTKTYLVEGYTPDTIKLKSYHVLLQIEYSKDPNVNYMYDSYKELQKCYLKDTKISIIDYLKNNHPELFI